MELGHYSFVWWEICIIEEKWLVLWSDNCRTKHNQLGNNYFIIYRLKDPVSSLLLLRDIENMVSVPQIWSMWSIPFCYGKAFRPSFRRSCCGDIILILCKNNKNFWIIMALLRPKKCRFLVPVLYRNLTWPLE